MLNEIIERVNNLSEQQQKDVLDYLRALPPRDKRDCIRKQAQLSIDVVTGDQTIQTDTRDISAGGVFINSVEKLDKGLNVRVVFSIPGQDTPFKLNGFIGRVEPAGIAVQFKDLDPTTKNILDDAIYKNFPDLAGCFEDKIFFRIEIAK